MNKYNIDVYEDDDVFHNATKPKRVRRTKEQKETEEYVSKDEMWNELYDYYKSLDDHYDWNTQKIKEKNTHFPPISDRLTVIINDIATKMGYRTNFNGYSYLSEMIGDAVLKMVKAVRDCSFKCFTIGEIISKTDVDDVHYINFLDKKGKVQKREKEEGDEILEIQGKEYIKFKANPFGYFSRITSHSYLNRIKKEKTLEETKRAFQSETWEKLYSDENFINVRRPKYVDPDENDVTYED